jgi:mono/diheme cytochrome c family protein
LYAQHCAACHGEKGDGQGLAARYLFPKPRDFRAGRFRLISTTNGVPTQADIEAAIVRGMPGSAMVSWAHLPDGERELLAMQVLELRRAGARDIERMLAAEDDEELTEEEINEAIAPLTTPGPISEVPKHGGSSPEAVARGMALYQSKGCAACHGLEGKGDGQQQMVDAEGLPTRPRDLTRGIFKGDASFDSVYRRLWLGMPGSPMPSSQNLEPQQVADVVHFVLSLSDEPTRQAAVLKRRSIIASRVARAPTAPSAALWNRIKSVRLTMTPLWWRDDGDPRLEVQAVHDGKSVSLRLSWNDGQANLHSAKSEAFEDAVAVELYRGSAEPFVGMGAAGSAVELWMWDADRQGRPLDVEDANPNLAVDVYPPGETAVETAEYGRPGARTAAQAELFLPALAAGNQIVPRADGRASTALEAGGPGTLTFLLPNNQQVQAEGQWSEGRWSVVMTRPLATPDAGRGLSLRPGDRVSIAFAIWDGGLRDRSGQKLITIWQDLQIAKTSPRAGKSAVRRN